MRRWVCQETLVCLVLLLGAAVPVRTVSNPNFPCTGNNGPADDVGLEEGSKSRIAQDTFRYLSGCNPQSLKDRLNLDPVPYPVLEKYYKIDFATTLDTITKQKNGRRARRVPLCVRSTKLGAFRAQMGSFTPIIRDLENKEQTYNSQSYYAGDPPIWFPKQGNPKYDTDFGVEDIRLTRIFTGDPKLPLLRQWFHMAIHMRDDQYREGIIVQAISAPMGLPFGEFRLDFDCNSRTNPLKDRYGEIITHAAGPTNYYKDSLAFPCSYRSEFHLRHPLVYTVGGSPDAQKKKYQEFHVHFNWIDSTCYESIAMQFLIILVKSFSRMEYDVFYTPALNHTFLDSNDGLPYPYYPGWQSLNQVYCNEESIPLYNQVTQDFVNKGFIQEIAVKESNNYNNANDLEADYGNPTEDNSQSLSQYFMSRNKDKSSANQDTSFTGAATPKNRSAFPSRQNTNGESQLEIPEEFTKDLEEKPEEDYIRAFMGEENQPKNRSRSEPRALSPDGSTFLQNPKGLNQLDTPEEFTNDFELDAAPEEDYSRSIMKPNEDVQEVHRRLAEPEEAGKDMFAEYWNTTISSTTKANFLRRKKRAERKPLQSKCTDRDRCIMGQFQIVQSDVAIIEYSTEFDDCTMTGNGINKRSPLECPPKAVTCEQYAKVLGSDSATRTKRRIEFRSRTLNQKMCDLCIIPDDSEIFRSMLPANPNLKGPTRFGVMSKSGVFVRRPVPVRSLVDVSLQGTPASESSKVPTTITAPAPPTDGRGTATSNRRKTIGESRGGTEADPDGHIPRGRLMKFDRLVIAKNQEFKTFHAFFLIFAWFIAIPTGTFTARYYKETGGIKGNGICGMPMWLVTHIAFSTYALVCQTIGIISVAFLITIDCDRLRFAEDKKFCEDNYGEKVTAHIVFGTLAMLIFVPQYCLGWVRPLSDNIRWVIQIIHSCGGYLGYIFATIAVFLTQTCVEVYIEVGLMILIHAIMFCAGCVMQIVQDKSLGLVSSRKVFPVLEVVQLRDNPPHEKAKTVIRSVHDAALVVVAVICMFTYNKVLVNDPLGNLDFPYDELNNSSNRLLNFSAFILPDSCSRINYIYFLQQIACDYGGINSTRVTFWCNNPKNETI